MGETEMRSLLKTLKWFYKHARWLFDVVLGEPKKKTVDKDLKGNRGNFKGGVDKPKKGEKK